ncbi:MAG: cysteine desulfurase [Flavobacteriaceae bacterium]|nr:cysteine desulfurase [Flavobacteriaceae bacterium]
MNSTVKPIYFDNAATTAVREEVVEKMSEVLKTNFGNASSSHSFGRSSKSIIEQCRKNIASHFNVTAGEIVFTSGGTEADNLVLRSAARDLGVKHFITSKIEHHAVLHTLQQLKREYNVEVSYVKLLDNGEIDFDYLEQLLNGFEKTLVSLMHVNNEVGNLLDIEKTSRLCKANNALFHTDSVQSIGNYKIDLSEIPIDFLAASAHKFHGPKGVGFSFVRKDSGVKPLIIGGEQERGLRAGTESIHNIVGLEAALDLAYNNLEEERKYISDLKHYFIYELERAIPDIVFNGMSANLEKSSYKIVNVALPLSSAKGDILLFELDLKGIACSKGSACQSGSYKGSHVLSEILSESNLKKPSLRFSFSKYNTKKEIDEVINVLKLKVN